MAFWQIIILLCVSCAIFVLWPLVKAPFLNWGGKSRVNQDQTQAELFQEHLSDLQESHNRGDIDQQQFAQLKLELQKTLLAENQQSSGEVEHKPGGKVVLLVMAVLLPALSVVLYTQLGAKSDWEIYQHIQALPNSKSQDDYSQNMRELAVMIQGRLNQTPENLQLQNLLAQVSMALQDYDQAVSAYRAILSEFPESARTMANLAQALFYRAGNTVTPEVREYTHKALELAPMMPEMLGLAGIDAKNQGDLRGAIAYWKRAVTHMDKNSRTAQGYLNGIAKAEQALRDAGESLDEPAAATDSGSQIQLKVALAEGAQVSPQDTLFVYARAWQGAKMPLAIKRMTAADLPTEVVLSEAMAMAPGMTIKSVEKLELVARISKSGTPMAKSGDWQGSKGPIVLGELDGAVEITIDKQIP